MLQLAKSATTVGTIGTFVPNVLNAPNTLQENSFLDLPLDILYILFSQHCLVPDLLMYQTVCHEWHDIISDFLRKKRYQTKFLENQFALMESEKKEKEAYRIKIDACKQTEGKCKTQKQEIDNVIKSLSNCSVDLDGASDFIAQAKKQRIRLCISLQKLSKELFVASIKHKMLVDRTKTLTAHAFFVSYRRKFNGVPPDGLLYWGKRTREANVSFVIDDPLTHICVVPKQSDQNFMTIDQKFGEQGWLKKMVPKMMAEKFAFAYVDPGANNSQIGQDWYDCPICSSPFHTMFYCENAQCKICGEEGHITRICSKK